MSDYHVKLAVQREKKESRSKAYSSSGFLPSMPVPLQSLSGSFDSAVVSSIASIC